MTTNGPSDAVRPLFLLSLPRAGSTLVQRILGAHPKISTVAEPWILLPLVYARRSRGIRAEYGHRFASVAISDFAKALDGGPETFDAHLRAFVEGLYRDAAENGATYFLDKTPHYLNIVDDVMRLFPDAKFIFLWRNPLAVLASLVDNFRFKQFEPYAFPNELFRGPAALASAFDANRDRAHAVRFEDLVGGNREEHWRGIFDYLELTWDPEILEQFSATPLRGRFGDPTGIHLYGSISAEPLDKWKQSLRGGVRRIWATRWLQRVGPEPFEIMGYDPECLLFDIQNVGPARVDELALDAVSLAGSAASVLVRKRALRVQDIPPLSITGKLARRRHFRPK
ncbi:MAG TPA: sulfotransferase [Solirubrobacteraceae bacterium]|nr:sulfotransferase [Solirubrobacteraceae bacterium]